MARVQQHDEDRDDGQNVVDAAEDPVVQRIRYEREEDDAAADFAAKEAEFAAEAEKRARQLHEEHRDAEAKTIHQEATRLMGEATTTMREVTRHEADVIALGKQRKQQLALALREMPRQSIETLRDAVNRITVFVENMSPEDKLSIGLQAHMTEARIEEVREEVIMRGQTLDEVLTSEYRIKHDPIAVIEDLVAFTAAVMTIADHFEPLLRLAREFGQLLLQFRI